MLEHKSDNISETRKGRGKVTKFLWRAYMNSQRSFERYHPRPPTASSFSRSGVHNPDPKLQPLYLRNGWSYGLQIWPEHS